jgi:phenylalanyl-tRNA synthetase beta chain
VKLSIAWLFDHIKENHRSYDVNDLIAKIIDGVAEIEAVHRVSLPLDNLAVACIGSLHDTTIIVDCPEWKKEYTLPLRKDSVLQAWYILLREGQSVRWATLHDVGSTKDGLFPAVFVDENSSKGAWKKHVESEDTLITIDNASLTHRADLWGHRGFAREVAALYDFTLIPEEHIVASIATRHYERQAPITTTFPLEVVIEDPERCKRLAVLNIPFLSYRASLIWMALRLARIDARPLHALVDMTNYVMYDIGQPMHMFDAQTITTSITARHAKEGETLVVLDGEELHLTMYDLVIADGDRALALAGIMGGRDTAVSATTTAVIIEAANFDAATIRATSARYKKRTEASLRFEKSLDSNQNTVALCRLVKLLDDNDIPYRAADALISVGLLEKEEEIEITHEEIVQRLGIPLSMETVAMRLQALGFGVRIVDNRTYRIVVPTYRIPKQGVIKEDIIEEIARLTGYSAFPTQLPTMQMHLVHHKKMLAIRAMKYHCAFALSMHEVHNYALYDEEFLQRIAYEPSNAATLKNPPSQDAQRLVTSLIPHLLSNIVTNEVGRDRLRFFEIARTWMVAGERLIERTQLAGVFFDKKSVDFYGGKAALESLFATLGLSVEWRKAGNAGALFDRHRTAGIWLGNNLLGYAGMIRPQILFKITDGEVFAFEIDTFTLLSYEPAPQHFKPLLRYQTVTFDLSIMVPRAITVDEMQKTIVQVDPHIREVALIDFFEKIEWKDQRSLTFRCTIADEQRTMTKEMIDGIEQKVIKMVQEKGAVLR